MTTPDVAGERFTVFGTSATLLVTAARHRPSGPPRNPPGGAVSPLAEATAGALKAARTLIDRELAAIDLACNRLRPDSEISLLNGSRGADVQVSELLAEAIEAALRAARLTGGDVDPTCGAALASLGYDRDITLITRDAPVTGPPAPAAQVIHRMRFTRSPALDNMARSAVGQRPQGRVGLAGERFAGERFAAGWQRVGWDRSRATVRLPPGVQLDLGATAKAWAADRCARLASHRLGRGVLISLGGDIAVAGPAPGGGWRVRVTDDHAASTCAPGQTVAISSGGLATSSVAVRAWRHGGEPVHHILDPVTGRPARSCWRTVSVAAASCLDANIASTAAIIRGEAAPAWLTRIGLPARLAGRDGSVVLTAGWPRDTAPPEAA